MSLSLSLPLSTFVLAIFNAQTAVSIASPRFSLGVCGSTFGSITDTSMNGHTVSLTPGAYGISVIADYQRGNCLSRSSSAAGGVLISSSSLGASYTKSIWAKLSGVVSFPNLWSSYDQGGGEPAGSHYLCIGDKGDMYAGHKQNGTQRTSVQDYQAVGANIWTHVVATFDSTTQTMTIYQNGVKTTSKIGFAPGTAWDGSNSLPSQLLNWNGPYGWIGCVTDINLYDSVLSAADVNNLYTTQLATTVCGTSVMAADNKPIVPIPASAGIPQPQLSLGVCGTSHPDYLSVLADVVDVSGHPHAVTMIHSASGLSIADSSDPVRGLAVNVGYLSSSIPITNSRLGSSYTVSAWVRLSSLVNWPIFVASQDQAGGESTGAFALYVETSNNQNGLAVLHVPDAVGGRRTLTDTSSAGAMPTNTWIHVAATFNGTSNMFTLYRNGVQTATGAAGNPAVWNASNSVNLQLAKYYGVMMQGQISDVTIWDSALTPKQMSNVYTRQSTYSVCDPAINVEESDDEWCNAMASIYGYNPADWACYNTDMCFIRPSDGFCIIGKSRSQRFPNTDLPGGDTGRVQFTSGSAVECQEWCFKSNLDSNSCQSWVWSSNDKTCYLKGSRGIYDYGIHVQNENGLTAGRMCPQNAAPPQTVATSLKHKWLTKCIINA